MAKRTQRKQERGPARTTKRAPDSGGRSDTRAFPLSYQSLVLLLLVVATVAVYCQVWGFGFVNYDDDKYVTANPHVLTGLKLANVAWAFTTGYFLNWHPLTWLSHMADCQLFGLNAGAHHLVNVLLHVANTVLLFELLRRMTGAAWRSLLVAALFALHPLHVQPVAWIAARKDLLSTLFGLLAMLGYAMYARQPTARRYGLVLLPFALGLMAKSMIVTLPCVLLLLDYWPLRRLDTTALAGESPRRRAMWLLIEKLPLFACSAIASVIASYLMVPGQFPFSVRISNALVSYVQYIRITLWPAGLSVFYPHPGNAIPLWQPIGAAALLLGISAGTVVFRRRFPYLIIGWLWYVGTLVPVIGLVDIAGVHGMADRYTYVPLIGLFIAGVWGAADLASAWRAPKMAIAGASVMVLATFTVSTATQISYWRDSVTLFTHTIAVTGNNPVAHNNLGLALAALGRKDEALAHYEQAAKELDGLIGNPLAHNNLASALTDAGKIDEAIAEYKKALAIDPDCAQAYNNLGALLANRGTFSEAIRCYEEALRIDPAYGSAHYNLGNALAKTGNIPGAIEHFGQAVRCDPENAMAHYNLAVALSSMNKIDEAIAEFLEVIKRDPNLVDAYVNLGVAKAIQKKFEEAFSFYSKALELDPGNAKAQQDVRNVLANLKREGKLDGATQQRLKALKVQP